MITMQAKSSKWLRYNYGSTAYWLYKF